VVDVWDVVLISFIKNRIKNTAPD